MPPLLALLLDWVLTACWPLVAGYGTVYFNGLLFATVGLLIGLVMMLPALLKKGRWKPLFDPKTAPTLAAMGFFSGLATAVFVSAVAYTTPANASIMAQVEVLYSAVLCALFLKEKITAKQAAASTLVVAGTSLIMWHDLSSPRWKGDLMILATPWMFQVSHLCARKLPKNIEAVTLTGGRIVYGIATMAPFCLWALLTGGRWSWEPRALSLLLIQGVFMSCANFILWYRAILGMELSKATTILLSYPALTVLFSWALGREKISSLQVVGLAVTMSGAYWVSRQVAAAGHVAETPGTDLIP